MAITNFNNKLPHPQSGLAIETLKDPYTFDFLNIGEQAKEREVVLICFLTLVLSLIKLLCFDLFFYFYQNR